MSWMGPFDDDEIPSETWDRWHEALQRMNGEGTPERVPKPPDDDRRYVCSKCKKELKLDYCKRIERIYELEATAAFVKVVHACPCQAWVRSTKYPWVESALRRLFGGPIPNLPWPHVYGREDRGEAVEAPPSPPEALKSPNELAIERWAYELEFTHTAHDFLLFCRGPRWND